MGFVPALLGVVPLFLVHEARQGLQIWSADLWGVEMRR